MQPAQLLAACVLAVAVANAGHATSYVGGALYSYGGGQGGYDGGYDGGHGKDYYCKNIDPNDEGGTVKFTIGLKSNVLVAVVGSALLAGARAFDLPWLFPKPSAAPAAADLQPVPLYWALKPLLGALPTAPTTTTTTTTAAPPSSAKWPSLAAIDDIYEKFWKSYGTRLYGADRDFFNKPFFPFFSRDDKTTTTTTTAPTTTTTPRPPEIPFYYHVNHGDPRYYYKKHPVYYYVSNSRPKYNSDPYYYYVDNSDSKYEYTKSIDPFYHYIGSPSNTNIEKTNISDITEKKDTTEKKDV
ncbi:Protein of unknown function [Gryllus bimaculatus]|nr:Protein of unknown function [Gryllus bimaculatus]